MGCKGIDGDEDHLASFVRTAGLSSCPFIGSHIRTELTDPFAMSRGARERIARHKRRGEVNGEMLNEFIAKLYSRFSSEEGATATEYALLIAGIALIMVVGARLLGAEISGFFDGIDL